jgi:single-strand DNA-binding protein
MNFANNVNLTGFLGADPELVNADQGKELLRLSLAQTEAYFDKESKEWKNGHTNWIRVAVFGKKVTRILVGLKKGDHVQVSGSLRTSEYEKDGQKRYSTEIIAGRVLRVMPVQGVRDEFENGEAVE